MKRLSYIEDARCLKVNTRQGYFSSIGYHYMCTTCFGTYKNHTKAGTDFIVSAFYDFCTDMPEDKLSTGRNM